MRDPMLKAIAEAMADQEKSRADLGRLLGLDGSQVNRIFESRPGKPTRRIQIHEMRKIEDWLGWTPGAAGPSGPRVIPLPGMVPLYGLVGASHSNRPVLAEQNILGYVPMHPAQANLRDAFALQVTDVSMAPRYEPGEIVYLAPNRFPLPGQDAVIVDSDNNGHLKKFVRRDGAIIRMRQLNPDEELEFDAAKITAIHAVTGRG